jgi:F-type H+-transporting ATPase subunit delta
VTGSPSTLARRYARALLDVATGAGGGLEQAVGTEIAAFARLLETNAPVRAALLHPSLGPALRRRVLAALADAAQVTPLTRRLLDLMASRDRLALLPALAEAYRAEQNLRRGVLTAEAASAVPLAPAQQEALVGALRTLVGQDVLLDSQVDAALLGGVVVRVGGRTYDGSVRGRLAALRARLATAS